jgi:predicted transposase YbfD/YdcC
MKSICVIESERHKNKTFSVERRYFLSSTNADASKHLSYSREHWGVESMHWVLDVQFKEDECHIRSENAAENMGTVRKIIYNLLKSFKKKQGMPLLWVH